MGRIEHTLLDGETCVPNRPKTFAYPYHTPESDKCFYLRQRAGAKKTESSDPMREAGAANTGRFVTVNCKVCPPHRGYSWSHHRSLHALDVDWNPIRKHKEAGAPYGWSDGSSDPVDPKVRPERRGGGPDRTTLTT